MASLRRKNISREIRDIKFPTSHVPEKPAAAEVPLRAIRAAPQAPRAPIMKRRRFPRWPFAIFLLAALAAAAAGGFFWYRGKAAQAERLREALVQSGHGEQTADILGLGEKLPATWGGWVDLISKTLSYYSGFGQASLKGLDALGRAAQILQQLPALVLSKDGPGLVGGLTALRDDLRALHAALEDLNARKEELQSLPDLAGYLAYAPDVERAQGTLEGLLGLLQAPGEHHLLILLGNSAELRPGGGFLGSFADLPFGNGTVGDITVHDVNEVDRGFAANIIPPQPVQAVAGRWRIADANWFFDYPQSARKTLELMARSSFYASSTAAPDTLDGAILVSPRVIQDLLKATGPLLLANGATTVDAATIIPLIQREVQEGQASGADAPKQVLSDLLPQLKEKLQQLDPGARATLLSSAGEWAKDKDLVLYFKDPALAKAAAYYGLDGSLYALPESFSGDYFAAVHANLGGGKSDAFISDEIHIESDLREDGAVMDRATVARTSRAGAQEEWWYRETNQDYLQIFTPPDAVLAKAEGGKARNINPRADYSKGFAVDPDVLAAESGVKAVAGIPAVSQFRQTGKNVFATWLTTPAGKTSIATFEYQRQLKNGFRDGDPYTFVFERQPGADQSLRVVLNAPPGFVWKEGGAQKYERSFKDAPGRVVVNLTLRKI